MRKARERGMGNKAAMDALSKFYGCHIWLQSGSDFQFFRHLRLSQGSSICKSAALKSWETEKEWAAIN